MNSKRVSTSVLFVFLGLFMLFAALFGGQNLLPAFAAEKSSSALEDLQKDETFDVNDYPDNAKDYSVKVIQIAESTDGELFIYTYQPCQKTTYIVATRVNMSLSADAEGTQLYSLTLLSCNGVLGKYRIDNLSVSDETIRHYNITSIFREWIKGIDSDASSDNVVKEVSFAVGKQYDAITEGDTVKYACYQTEVIQITDKWVQRVRYSDGRHIPYFDPYEGACDSHYVAFNTDKRIDYLLEAELTFVTKKHSYQSSGFYHEESYGEPITHSNVLLTYTDDVSYQGDYLFAKKYTWKRIQSVDDFIKSESITGGTKDTLNQYKWVLRFYETAYSSVSHDLEYRYTETYVTELTILRLKFIRDGKTYNLGTVDNIQGERPGSKPAITKDELSLWDWLLKVTGIPKWAWILIIVAALLLGVLVLAIFFPIIFEVLWKVISAPFRWIAALIKKSKRKPKGKSKSGNKKRRAGSKKASKKAKA